jgi:hypothetical protein
MARNFEPDARQEVWIVVVSLYGARKFHDFESIILEFV